MRPRLRYDSLRTRIIVWAFIPTTAILFAVALVTYFSYSLVTEDLVVQRNRELARLSAGQLAGELGAYVDSLESVARTADMYQGVAIVQQAALRDLSDRLAVFDGGVVVLDPRGRVSAETGGPSVALEDDWSTRPLFQEALLTRSPVFSDVLDVTSGGDPTVGVSVPILGEGGEFRGTMVGLFRLGATAVSAFYGDIVRLRVGEEGDPFLVDGVGRVIYDRDPSMIAADFSSDPVVEDVLAGRVAAVRTRNSAGTDVMASYSPVPGTDWGLVSVERWSTLSSSSRGYQRFLLVLLVLGIVVPTLVAAFGVRRITRPIASLTQAAAGVAQGRFERAELQPTFAELGELTEQFNYMSARLEESYEQLERRVEDRTRELATLNAVAAVSAGSLELRRVLQDSLSMTVEAMDMHGGGAFTLTEEGSFALVVHEGLSDEFAKRVDGLPVGDWVEWFGGGLTEPAERTDDTFPEGQWRDFLLAEPVGLTACTPLAAKGRTLGAILLVSREHRTLVPEEVSLLASIGNQVGMAMDNARLYQQAEETAAAAERSRLARDLHDAVSQTLFSASLIAEVLPRIWDKNPEQGKDRLEELRQLTRGALAEMRTLLIELRPAALQEAELPELLKQLVDAVTGRARIPVELEIEGEIDAPSEVRVGLYRIAQEALNNVVKHAEASRVTLELDGGPGTLRLRIADDGTGFDPTSVSSDHLGLGIMAERAEAVGASLDVRSRLGSGTEIVVLWPRANCNAQDSEEEPDERP